MYHQISIFDLKNIESELPAIGSTIYNVTGCKVVKGIVTKYSTDGFNKYLHGIDDCGTFYRNVGAMGKGMFVKKGDAAEYLKTW
ncbi:hypothetical protein CLPUN_42030 [Clostridium puniceum]|uniref:Uncharacterized protein n=1 Tax=Clostridium puniceum TaxID=29367 RepID=A0A1S8T935_9CLOT|nr:hypothetical protein [Clostridium puniceum]OOM73965.1 hypothetical protein CLPUN_42030 [Clostridium puniceum]